MATLHLESDIDSVDPIDMLEQIALAHDWPFDRSHDGELSAAINGSWCDYHFGFSWRERERALQMTCAFDMRVPTARRSDVYTLLGLINEQLWLGHFVLWSDDGVLMFRHASLVGMGATPELCEDLIDLAVATAERFYPAFQFVLWGGKTPADALAAALIETVGEA